MNPGLSACKADALPLSYTPFCCIQDAVKRAGLMNPKPRSFQRQAVPVTRSPVPSPILPRVGDRLGPRRGERPRGGDRERPRGGLRSRRGGEREREAMVLAGFGPRARQKQCFGDSLKLAYTPRAGAARAREGAARELCHTSGPLARCAMFLQALRGLVAAFFAPWSEAKSAEAQGRAPRVNATPR